MLDPPCVNADSDMQTILREWLRWLARSASKQSNLLATCHAQTPSGSVLEHERAQHFGPPLVEGRPYLCSLATTTQTRDLIWRLSATTQCRPGALRCWKALVPRRTVSSSPRAYCSGKFACLLGQRNTAQAINTNWICIKQNFASGEWIKWIKWSKLCV